MASTLGTFFYVALLLVNSVAILNEGRFLARIGWTTASLQQQQQQMQMQHQQQQHTYGMPPQQPFNVGNAQDQGVKARMITLISAVRMLLRAPLIVLNITVIIYELILG